MNRVNWVDVGKGISILLVALYHTHLILDNVGLSHDLYALAAYLFKPVRMPLFFAISGALASTIIWKDWATVTRKKLWFFTYLFALWSTIHIVFFKYIVEHPFYLLDHSLATEIALNFVNPKSPIWFIWALAFYFLFARLLRNQPIFAILTAVSVSIFASSEYMQSLHLSHPQKGLLTNFPFFVATAVSGKYLLVWADHHPIRLLVFGVVLAATAKLLPEIPDIAIETGIYWQVTCLGGLCAGISASVFLSRISFTRSIFSYFGRNTLPIYLINFLVIPIIAIAVKSMDPPDLATLGIVPISACIGIAISLAIKKGADIANINWLFAPPALSRTRAQTGSHAIN